MSNQFEKYKEALQIVGDKRARRAIEAIEAIQYGWMSTDELSRTASKLDSAFIKAAKELEFRRRK